MEFLLNDEGFEHFSYDVRKLFNGVQYLYKFENNYGASVVKHDGSYGHEDDLWELAVIKFTGDGENIVWDINYDTDITNDVIGRLTDEEVRDLLSRIKEL